MRIGPILLKLLIVDFVEARVARKPPRTCQPLKPRTKVVVVAGMHKSQVSLNYAPYKRTSAPFNRRRLDLCGNVKDASTKTL